MKEYYANTIFKTATLDNFGKLSNGEELFPNSYKVETYMGHDNFMKYIVFESEEEYIWYKLQN